jgi:scyllo-inositol 2-dehydrogenase (NADP+)
MMMSRSKIFSLLFALMLGDSLFAPAAKAQAPFRIGVVGLVHGHVSGFFGQALKRTDVQVVGIAEPDRALFDKYAKREHLSDKLYYPSLEAMLSAAKPEAVVLYTNTFDHRAAVEACAKAGLPVMMEKPLAVSYRDALAMEQAARTSHIHVLVNYETTWYASNKAAYDMLQQGELGNLRKMVFRDGHQGPKEINVPPEFFAWLTNPKLNGAGALYDFGCYGADLATWFTHGQQPSAVTAVTQRIKPSIYPEVDDEADVVVTYPSAIAIIQGSWNWPYAIKDMVVYGTSASAQTMLRDRVEVQREGNKQPQITTSTPLQPPYDDSLHYFAGIVRGQIPDDDESLSSLHSNVIVSEILDAARRSAENRRTVTLPLQ